MRDPARLLVFCDEDAEMSDPVAALAAARTGAAPRIRWPCWSGRKEVLPPMSAPRCSRCPR